MKHAFSMALIILFSGISIPQLSLANEYSPSQWLRLRTEIMNDMNALLSDTVNEGETQAWVKQSRKNGPHVNCNAHASKNPAYESILFCRVEFDVRLDSRSKSEVSSCRLIYYVDRKLRIARGAEALIQACTEYLQASD